MRRLTVRNIAVAALVALAGCGSSGDKVVPKVVGERLDLAESDVKDHGLDFQELGGGVFGIVVRSHWTVCSQEPQPGTKGAEKVKLVVGRFCASSSPSPASTTPASSSGESSSSDADGVRTALSSAGYSVSTADPGTGTPRAQAALSVKLGNADVAIYFYSTFVQVAKASVQFDALVKSKPKQIHVTTAGTHFYVGTVQEPATFPRAKLAKLVRIAEGP